MPNKTIKNSFNAGELSPYLDGRGDLSKYYNGCATLVNGTVLPYGGVVKRSGTEYIAKAKGQCRIIPFEFSADDTMIIELGNLYARFYKSGDRVMTDSATISDITETDATTLTVTTSGAHGFSAGDIVRFTSVGGATELNFNGNHSTEFTLATVPDTTHFTITIDTTTVTAWTSGGTVAAIYELTTTYATADLFDLHYTQSADVVYITHEDYPPRKLSRLADNSWTIADIDFTGGPFLTENTTAAYLVGFARTGGTARSGYYFPAGATGTITASGGHTPFLSTHVGAYWLIKHVRPDNTQSIASGGAGGSGGAIKIKGDFAVTCTRFATGDKLTLYRKQGNGGYQEYRAFNAATSYTATEEEDDVYYYIAATGTPTIEAELTAKNQFNYGVVKITGYTSSTVLSCTVTEAVLSDNATDNAVTTSLWAEGAWSPYRGYPRTLAFYEDRMWYAGTTNNPQTLWGSTSTKYDNFTVGTGLDNESVQATINDSDVSNIQWMTADETLLVGTTKKEYKVSAGNIDDPIAPTDVKARFQSANGSDNIQPALLNNAIFYAQCQGRKMRAMRFTDTTLKFESDDATMLANHMFESAPVQFSTQRIPDSILWAVRSDGALCSFSYEPKEVVAAWSRHVTGGVLYTPAANNAYFESVAVIGGSTEDDIWVSVKRTINGTTYRYIEKFSTRIFDQTDEAMMVDCAKIVDGGFTSQNIVYAADTVRYGSGVYGSGTYGV